MADIHDAVSSINKLEDLAGQNTVIHRIHPIAKIITTFVYLIAVISFNRYAVSALIPYLFYIVILMSLADIPYGLLMRRVAIALPFSLFAGISNMIFDRTGAFLFYGFVVTDGMVSFVSIMLKTLMCVSAVLILISTTTMTEISYQLVKMKVPTILVMQITMTYRYISVLLEEVSVMYTAYLLRSPNEKGVRMKDMGNFVGQLLLRSIDRAERVYYAMKCRGFDGSMKYSAAKKANTADYVFALTVCGAMIALRFINLSALLGGLF